MGFALWLHRQLVHVDPQGAQWPPGGGHGRRWKQADGSEVALISQGDTFDVFIGRRNMYNVTLEAQTAKQLAWWLIKWWVLVCWCGLKLKLWDWTLSAVLPEVTLEPPSTRALERARER